MIINNELDTYDASFFLAVGSILLSALTLSIKYCLRSKCEHFTLLWGLVKIDRRVDLETQIDLKQIEDRDNNNVSEKKEKK